MNQPATPPPSLWRRGLRLAVIAGLLAIILASAWRAWQATDWAGHRQLNEAERLLELWRLDEAADLLAECRRRWPGLPRVHWLAARTARLREKYDEARDHLDRFRRYGGDGADVELEMSLIEAYRGNLDAVESRLIQLTAENHADSYFIFDALATGYRKSLRREKARACILMWQERFPDAIPALVQQAWLDERSARRDEAIKCYHKILQRDPGSDLARFGLAELFVLQNSPDEALEQYAVLQSRRRDDPRILKGQTACWLMQGELDRAQAAVDQLQPRFPDDEEVLLVRARLAMSRQNWPEAEQLFREVVAKKPLEAGLLQNYQQCLAVQGKDDEAKRVLERGQQLKADLERIQELVIKAVPATPHQAAHRHEIGALCQRHGAFKEAIRWFLSAVREDPSHQPSRRALIECYEKTQRLDLAAEQRRQLQQASAPR